jgi:hypothetical protein
LLLFFFLIFAFIIFSLNDGITYPLSIKQTLANEDNNARQQPFTTSDNTNNGSDDLLLQNRHQQVQIPITHVNSNHTVIQLKPENYT